MKELKNTNVVKITSLPVKCSNEYSAKVLETVIEQGYTVI